MAQVTVLDDQGQARRAQRTETFDRAVHKVSSGRQVDALRDTLQRVLDQPGEPGRLRVRRAADREPSDEVQPGLDQSLTPGPDDLGTHERSGHGGLEQEGAAAVGRELHDAGDPVPEGVGAARDVREHRCLPADARHVSGTPGQLGHARHRARVRVDVEADDVPRRLLPRRHQQTGRGGGRDAGQAGEGWLARPVCRLATGDQGQVPRHPAVQAEPVDRARDQGLEEAPPHPLMTTEHRRDGDPVAQGHDVGAALAVGGVPVGRDHVVTAVLQVPHPARPGRRSPGGTQPATVQPDEHPPVVRKRGRVRVSADHQDSQIGRRPRGIHALRAGIAEHPPLVGSDRLEEPDPTRSGLRQQEPPVHRAPAVRGAGAPPVSVAPPPRAASVHCHTRM